MHISSLDAATLARKATTVPTEQTVVAEMGDTLPKVRIDRFLGGLNARIDSAMNALGSVTGMSFGPDGRPATAMEHFGIAASHIGNARKLLETFNGKNATITTWTPYTVKSGEGWSVVTNKFPNNIKWQQVAQHNKGVFEAHGKALTKADGSQNDFVGEGWKVEIPQQQTVNQNLSGEQLMLAKLTQKFSEKLLASVPAYEAAAVRQMFSQMGL